MRSALDTRATSDGEGGDPADPAPPSPDSEGDSSPPAPLVPAVRFALSPLRRASWFLRRVIDKAEQDNIFFMAGAISFNVLAAIVPLLLFVVGVSGFVLQARWGDPAAVLTQLIRDNLPAIGGDLDFILTIETQIQALIEERRGLTAAGALLLVWFSTRLVGTLRTALGEVFDVAQDRGILRGKLFDAGVVLVGGALFTLNMGITAGVGAAQDYGVGLLGIEGQALTRLQQTVAHLVAFASIWVLFLGTYHYLPARRVPWRTALIAATFAAVGHEILKIAFGFYATEVANFGTTYGNLITGAVLFFWIYYEAQVFILGGEFAQVWTMRRALRVGTRRALFDAKAR